MKYTKYNKYISTSLILLSSYIFYKYKKNKALSNHKSPDESEKTFGTNLDAKPIIIENNENDENDDLIKFLLNNKNKIRNNIKDKGAVLLRGFSYNNNNNYTNILSYLEYDIDSKMFNPGVNRNYGFISLFGKVPPIPVGDRIFVSNKLERSRIIMPHTELAYSTNPPKVIAFRSHKNSVYGGSETPLWNTNNILSLFSSDMYNLFKNNLCRTSITYTIKDFINNFDVNNLEDGIKLAKDIGRFNVKILENDKIKVWNDTPFIVEKDGFEYLQWNGDYWGKLLIKKWLNNYKNRYPFWERWIQWIKFKFTNYYDEDGAVAEIVNLYTNKIRQFTDNEINEIHDVFTKSMYLMEWKENDVLIVNNIKFGHARSNLYPKGERQLHVMYSEI